MAAKPLKPGAAQRCIDALALLHKPPQLSDAERAAIAAELARPREDRAVGVASQPGISPMIRSTCGMCRFWHASNPPIGGGGECRRFPPVPVPEPSFEDCSVYTQFPNTEATDWCGEFQALPPG